MVREIKMREWETEDEYAAAAAASLPTPTDTPYRTPSRGSRRSSRQKSISPGPSSSPPPLPSGEKGRRDSRDVTNDESISILDPRRFTPTLHANLVSEILALRRDQEEKIKIIENLESDLHEARGEHEEFQATLVSTSKENRSLKRQLALLEGGTSSALSELARERDEAFDSHSETRKRLEGAQKKIRSQEEDADRVHELWANDKDNWEEEKRKLERRVHVAESRLKTVLDEVASFQEHEQNGHHEPESEIDESSRDTVHGHGSDAASIRTMSMTNSIRFSLLNGPNGYGGSKLNGMSLADELNLDEDEDQTDHDGRESVISVRHNRNQSRESVMSRSHRRNQSIESLMRPGSVARGRLLAQQAVLDRLEDGIMEDDENPPPSKVEYVDTGVQFSPPPSPKLQAVENLPIVESLPMNSLNGSPKMERSPEPSHREWEVEANQRRKRVHASPPLVIEPPTTSSMVSSASQTIEDPLSPPRTPISPTRAPPPPPTEEKLHAMTSISTQTDVPEPALQSPTRAPPPPPIAIPSIQLHPPNSAPATPQEPLLPQHFKDAGCQVAMQVPVPTRSISVQTEEIRVAQRLNLLPVHLQPSSISSKPPSPEPSAEESKRFSPIPGNLPPRNPRRMNSRTSLEQEFPSSPPQLPENTRDAYPGNNDDGPLSKDRTSIRRPHRISSLFAGFDNVSSDDADDFADGDMSDNDFRTALSAPRPQAGGPKPTRRISSGPTSVPEHVELSETSRPFQGKGGMRYNSHQETNGDFSLPEVQPLPSRTSKAAVRQLDKPLTLVTNNKPNTMRRAALIQSGVAAHQGRSRSPSLPEPVKEPPFPIPTRASSRRPPFSASAPSDGNRSPTYGRGGGAKRGHYRANSIRKVKSAAVLPRGGRASRRNGSRSPPPMSASTEAPESPQLPPMPHNEITTPRYMRDTGSSRYRSHRQQPSTTTANTSNTANTGNGSTATSNATSVVDAIAQTMVGEWMFKYVRRRKSFGVSESNGLDGENANGVRHKRWVWLAPYERAVMWSSKQPTSGSALMGKTGRKLTIQSVLDVKDDNPPPKGSAPLFNRSILILTPARALKFTATSAERHYVWLTALSFLAHSSQAVPEIIQQQAPLPAPNVPDFEMPRQQGRLRKNGIRDSIRVAKGKTISARQGPISVHSSQQDSIREAESIYSGRTNEVPDSAADPPIVPRFTERGRDNYGPPLAHNRKRSNTGSRVPPPLSFRGFSGPASSGHAPTSSTAGQSVGTTGSSDIYNQSQPSSSIAGGGGFNVSSGRSSIRSSDASGRPGAVVNNFFDAVGTMRMEAFISPMALSRFDDYPDEQDEMDFVGMHRRHSRERRRRSKQRDRDSVYGSSRGRPSEDYYGGSKTAGEEEYGRFDEGGGYDPFRGF